MCVCVSLSPQLTAYEERGQLDVPALRGKASGGRAVILTSATGSGMRCPQVQVLRPRVVAE